MECDICLEKFDHSINKPLVLFRCGHTLCSKCVESLIEKKCPSCSCLIEEIRPNWSLLKIAPESEYDIAKIEALKSLNEIESIENKLEDTVNQTESNLDLIKRLKSQVECRANELTKQINLDKKELLKEIEKKCKTLNQQPQQSEPSLLKKNELKEKLSNNKLEKQQLIELKSDLTSHLSKLNLKTKDASEFADSFQFSMNEKTRLGENLIGSIKKHQVFHLVYIFLM